MTRWESLVPGVAKRIVHQFHNSPRDFYICLRSGLAGIMLASTPSQTGVDPLEQAMDGWKAGDSEANGIRLQYTRTGGAKPSVVLALGEAGSGLCWTPRGKAKACTLPGFPHDASILHHV